MTNIFINEDTQGASTSIFFREHKESINLFDINEANSLLVLLYYKDNFTKC